MKTNILYHGDCIKILREKIFPESIPVVYADPPYNLSGKALNLKNNTTGGPFYKMNEKWDTFNYNDYLDFTNKWISEIKNILLPNGSLFVSCTQHNIAEIITSAKDLGLKLNNIITWYKTNAMPNITKRTFTHSTEYVCWFVKGKNWIFNYEAVKQFNPNKTKDGKNKQMRDFLDFIEIPIVQGKERFRGEEGRAIHPTQKPEVLLDLIIRASSNHDDIVLDPFLGTGTTTYVAAKLQRKWIGIEQNDEYFKISQKRMEQINPSIF
ncbi:MAG: site-specific DNA-methyltransferase [Bacteroidales bacterium]|nr:site-specific DNA-methyltransferase [Bacteroidales bacterium]